MQLALHHASVTEGETVRHTFADVRTVEPVEETLWWRRRTLASSVVSVVVVILMVRPVECVRSAEDQQQQVANKVPFARLRPPRFSGAEAETASRGLLARWDDLVYFYRRFNPPKAHAGVVRRIVLRYKTVANMNEALRSAYEGADLDHKSRRPTTYYPSMLVPFEPESPGLSTFGVRSLTSRLVPSSDDPLEREWHIVCRVHSALVADMDDMDYCTGASLDC